MSDPLNFMLAAVITLAVYVMGWRVGIRDADRRVAAIVDWFSAAARQATADVEAIPDQNTRIVAKVGLQRLRQCLEETTSDGKDAP